MVLFPHAQQRAQAELDSIVGSGRLPTFSDKDNLPYVTAVMYETLRWHTVTPLSWVMFLIRRVYGDLQTA